MKLLRDCELRDLISRGKIISSGIMDRNLAFEEYDSPIQACSLDLHIGQIYSPKNGDSLEYTDSHCLKPGGTVVVTTEEELDMPRNVGAIAFVPSHISEEGILATNPGHIDPGYRGIVRLTLINMGKENYALKKRDILVTLLLFQLDQEVTVDYAQRLEKKEAAETKTPMESEDAHAGEKNRLQRALKKLAPDFMNFEERSKRIAEEKIKSYVRWVEWIGGIIVVLGFFYGIWSQCQKNVLEARIIVLEDRRLQNTERVSALEKRVEDIMTSDQRDIPAVGIDSIGK